MITLLKRMTGPVVLALTIAACAAAAQAQTYPSREVRFVSAFAAGSGADLVARFYADQMRPLMGQTVIVENKPGALGNIGSEYVSRAKPDGYTISIAAGSAMVAAQNILKAPTIDPGKSLQVVTLLSKLPTMIVVPADSPYTTIAELTAALKKKGAKASYGFANPSSQVFGALYASKAGLEAVPVSYRAVADFINDLSSGTLDFAIPDSGLALAQRRAGKWRILAVATGERMKSSPDIPSIAEYGYDINLVGWWAAMVPMDTPRPIVDQLGVWFKQVVNGEAGQKFIAGIAADPWTSTPEEGQAFFRDEIEKWGDYVRIAKIEKQ